MTDAPKGFERGEDGVLRLVGGVRYKDPCEAVMIPWAGVYRLGCTERVSHGYYASCCGKVAKHDPDARGNPTRCGIHSAAANDKRKAAAVARDVAARTKSEARSALWRAERQIEAALRQIADGHNDPRQLAGETIAAVDAARAKMKQLEMKK